jgi:threonine synthase
MRYVSLTNPADTVSFQGAIENGVSHDTNSVYVPEAIPRLSTDEIDSLIGADPIHIGKTMLRPYVEGEISESGLDDIVRKATTFDIPLVDVGDRKVLEVFHGPTMTFKDVAAQYLALMMSNFSLKEDRPTTVLVASSGDTARAIGVAFANMPGVNVVLAYAKDRASSLQQEQMRRMAPNVHTLEVDGSFDDCLDLTRAAFEDKELREELNLTTANSINIGRLLPQITFHTRIFSELGYDTPRIIPPAGNWGNLLAGLFGKEMGIPSAGYIGANNANDLLARYLADGRYEPLESIPTLSNAMDVGNPANGPRLKWLFGGDIERIRAVLSAVSVSDEETIRTIQEVHDETGYVLEPHSAVAYAASGPGDVIIATASPEVFAEELREETGIEVDNGAQLEALRQTPESYIEMPNSVEDYKAFLRTLSHN